MERANEVLKGRSLGELCSIANISDSDDVVILMYAFAGSLMIEPMMRWERQRQLGNNHIKDGESCVQFSMYIGSMGIPQHWTEAFVAEEEAKNDGTMKLVYIDMPLQKKK